MDVEELERLVHRVPFQPYRLRLDDGEEIVVRHPRKSHVSGNQVALVGDVRPVHGLMHLDRFRIVRADRVVEAHTVEVPPRP